MFTIGNLKHVRRRQPKQTSSQINYCEEELLCIIHCMYTGCPKKNLRCLISCKVKTMKAITLKSVLLY